jgi:hypothetical protein
LQGDLAHDDPATVEGSAEQLSREIEAWQLGEQCMLGSDAEVPDGFVEHLLDRRDACLETYHRAYVVAHG